MDSQQHRRPPARPIPVVLAILAVPLAGCPGPTLSAPADLLAALDGGGDLALANADDMAAAGRRIDPRKTGSITLMNGITPQPMGAPARLAGAMAQFQNDPTATGDFSLEDVAPCTVLTVKNATVDANPPLVGAGVITITGGRVPVTLTPDARNTYPTWQDVTNGLWDGGETITVKAAGGTVPAFTFRFIAPTLVDITEPPGGPEPLAIDRTRDLVWHWTGGAQGTLQVQIVEGAGDSPTTILYCTYPTAAGLAVIPAAALGKLTPNSSGAIAIMSGGLDLSQAAQMGGYSVSLFVDGVVRYQGIPVVGGVYRAVN